MIFLLRDDAIREAVQAGRELGQYVRIELTLLVSVFEHLQKRAVRSHFEDFRALKSLQCDRKMAVFDHAKAGMLFPIKYIPALWGQKTIH